MLATLERWDRTTSDEKRVVASRLEQVLAPKFRFLSLETSLLGDQRHTLATFATGDLTFTLLPGYVGELGYDPARQALPADLTWEYDEFMAMTGTQTDNTFADYARTALTPLRSVTLRPFLVQTRPTSLERRHQQADGRWFVDQAPPRTDLLAQIATEGFRFPTSDEWEFACSGGSRALFRWGDTWPPIDWAPNFQRQPSEWRADLMPNAFGLNIAQDPWHLEFCAEPHIVRGGDGGTSCSAGVGRYNVWLTLATSYCWQFKQRIIDHPRAPLLRRVLDLSAVLEEA